MEPSPIVDVDAFDLPEWLGTGAVSWLPESGLRSGHRIRGRLTGAGGSIACDLLAVDQAYPVPVTDADSRARVHQAWQHDQVVVGEYDDRLSLGVPGTGFDADRVLDALARLAKAVGASAEDWSAELRIGVPRPRRAGR